MLVLELRQAIGCSIKQKNHCVIVWTLAIAICSDVCAMGHEANLEADFDTFKLRKQSSIALNTST